MPSASSRSGDGFHLLIPPQIQRPLSDGSEGLRYLGRFSVGPQLRVRDGISSNNPIQEEGVRAWPPVAPVGSGFAYSIPHRGDSDEAPLVHCPKVLSPRRWLRVSLRGGISHGFDRVFGRRGRDYCLRAENDRHLLGGGLVQRGYQVSDALKLVERRHPWHGTHGKRCWR